MPVDTIATNVFKTLKSEIDKVMSEPPKHEVCYNEEGFSWYSAVKPEFTLSSLGYTHSDYPEEVNIRRVQQIAHVMNKQLNRHKKDDVSESEFTPEPENMMFIRVVRKNNDYVFVLNLA